VKTSTRKRIGAVVLGSSVISGLLLAWCGRQQHVVDSHTFTTSSFSATSVAIEIDWPPGVRVALLVLVVVAALGILLLLVPERNKTNV
jgi:hypothetical protein